MSRFRAPSIRTLVAALAAVPVLAVFPAAASEADIVYYIDNYYSSATYSQQVGKAYGFCDGDYILSGTATPYVQTRFVRQCP